MTVSQMSSPSQTAHSATVRTRMCSTLRSRSNLAETSRSSVSARKIQLHTRRQPTIVVSSCRTRGSRPRPCPGISAALSSLMPLSRHLTSVHRSRSKIPVLSSIPRPSALFRRMRSIPITGTFRLGFETTRQTRPLPRSSCLMPCNPERTIQPSLCCRTRLIRW